MSSRHVLSLQARALARLPREQRRRLRETHPELTAEADREQASVIGRAFARARRNRAYVTQVDGRDDTGVVCYSSDQPRTKRTIVECILSTFFNGPGDVVTMHQLLSFLSGTHAGRVFGVRGDGTVIPHTPRADAVGRHTMTVAETRRFFMALPKALLEKVWASWSQF